MDDRAVILADPFGSKCGRVVALPADARLACAYEVFVQFEYFSEAAFFRRTDATDELWIGEDGIAPVSVGDVGGIGLSEEAFRAQFDRFICAFVVPRAGDERSACLGLLELLLRARFDFCAPEEFSVPGIVDAPAYDGLVARIANEREENKRKARAGETEIIRVARELGLQPEPTGDGPSHWCATCPGRNHHLLIGAESNSFGCGYCRRKGSVEELRAFVAERRAADEPTGPTR
jgi:hypothetical protein